MSAYRHVSDAVLLTQILTERQRQRTIYSDQHDMEHDGAQWIAVIAMLLGKAAAAELGGGPKDYERRLVQIAATAMAALECEERRQ